MANGTIAFDTLQTSGQITGTAKSVDTDYVVNGSAKSWLNLDGKSTISITDSFNVDSVADRGTGLYTHSLTTLMSNTNFVGSGNAKDTAGDVDGRNRMTVSEGVGTSGAHVNTFTTDGGASDVEYVSSIIHGDLA